LESIKYQAVQTAITTMSTELLNPTAPMAASLPIPPAPKAATRAERAALRHKQRNSLGAAKNPTNNYQKKEKGKSLKKEMIKLRPQSEKLYQDAQNRRVSLEKKRESLDIECTFAPKITRKGKMSSPPPTDENKRTSRSELLYQDAAKRKVHQEKLKSQLTPSFKPIMSKVSARTSERAIKKRKPLYQPNSMKQRDAEVEKIRQRLVEEEQAKIEKTRVSRVVYKSKRRGAAEQQSCGVVKRMQLAAEKSKVLHEKLLKEKEMKEKKILSFKPTIGKGKRSSHRAASSSSSSSGSTSTSTSSSGSTFDRLYQGASAQRERREALLKQKEQASKKTLTFRPKIREANGQLRLAKARVNNTAWVDQQVREGTMKLKHKKEAPTYKQVAEERELQQQMEDLTFQPSITSPLSSPESDGGRVDGVVLSIDAVKKLGVRLEMEEEKEDLEEDEKRMEEMIEEEEAVVVEEEAAVEEEVVVMEEVAAAVEEAESSPVMDIAEVF